MVTGKTIAFEQFNGTLKFNYRNSTSKNMYLKANINYENSNATYTGLTKYSFLKNPRYNPKEHDNFEVFRTSIDFIQTEKLSSSVKKTNTAFFSFLIEDGGERTISLLKLVIL